MSPSYQNYSVAQVPELDTRLILDIVPLPGLGCSDTSVNLTNGAGTLLAMTSPTVYKVSMTERAMQEATFLILTALADGSQHGYGIIAEVQEISGDRVRLRAGTLYTALDRLRSDGLIGVDREEIVEGRLRRYYRLTPEGTGRLAAEAARLQANAAAALTRLKPHGVIT